MEQGKNHVRLERRDFYASNIDGQYIVNAITGAKYPWKIGSFDDQRFFKVTSTANNVTWRSGDYGKRVYNKLYYESPFEYMNHRNIKLEKSVIDLWLKRINEHFPDNPYRLDKLKQDNTLSDNTLSDDVM